MNLTKSQNVGCEAFKLLSEKVQDLIDFVQQLPCSSKPELITKLENFFKDNSLPIVVFDLDSTLIDVDARLDLGSYLKPPPGATKDESKLHWDTVLGCNNYYLDVPIACTLDYVRTLYV